MLGLLILGAVHPAAADEAASTARLTYAAYAAGFNVLRLAVNVTLGPDGYAVAIAGRTAGTARVFYRSDWVSTAQGVWAANGVAPSHYDSRGISGGEPRHVAMDYAAGSPVLRALEPPDDGEHEPVPPQLQRDTIDTLSAMVLLIRHASTSGRCDAAGTVFDGRRLSSIAAHGAGIQALPASSRSNWQGAALRCDFDGRQLAGFAHEQSPEQARRPQHGVAWLAALSPGGPLLPVRVQFDTRYFGAATMYLTGGFTGALPDPEQIR